MAVSTVLSVLPLMVSYSLCIWVSFFWWHGLCDTLMDWKTSPKVFPIHVDYWGLARVDHSQCWWYLSHCVSQNHVRSYQITLNLTISHQISESDLISSNFTKSHHILSHLTISQWISPNLTNFNKSHWITPYLTKSHQISLNLTISLQIWLNLAKLHRISLNLTIP